MDATPPGNIEGWLVALLVSLVSWIYVRDSKGTKDKLEKLDARLTAEEDRTDKHAQRLTALDKEHE